MDDSSAVDREQRISDRNRSMRESRSKDHRGVIGLVNIGNSCYMNASLQALANCPPFCQFFIECFPPTQTNPLSSGVGQLFKKMWISERNPGNLNPRIVSSKMRQAIFRGSSQQDAQEFIRCFLSQIHDELAVPIYQKPIQLEEAGLVSIARDQLEESNQSHSSNSSTGSLTRLMVGANSNGSEDSVSNSRRSNSLSNSPFTNHKVVESAMNLYNSLKPDDRQNKATNSHQLLDVARDIESTDEQLVRERKEEEEEPPLWTPKDTIVVDIKTGGAYKHQHQEGLSKESIQTSGEKNDKTKRSIISEVFEGELESTVECLHCKNVSVTKEPFQDLSVPIPGRKDINSVSPNLIHNHSPNGSPINSPTIGAKVCRVFKTVVGWAQDMMVDPPTSLMDCFNMFFDPSELTGDNKYYCEHCCSLQNSRNKTCISKLPEILCVHLKRFRYDSFFASKISRYIRFPLTALSLSSYIKHAEGADDHSGYTYELVSMVTHYGGASGGHYVAYAKHRGTDQWHEFNDSRVSRVSTNEVTDSEAYLLFYRKVPVTPIPPLDIADIVPPPEVHIPSKDTAYISRHWLMLRNLCVDPGPVMQYHYTCCHGGVLPGKEDFADRLVLPMKRSIWKELVKLHGGGTPLESKATCLKCQDNLKELLARREKEREEANKIQDADKAACLGTTYLLSSLWLKQWQNFVHCKSLEVDPPGVINNSCLLQASKERQIKFRTKSQFWLISYGVWKYLYDIYGGGPHVTTTSPDTLEL